ncbi:MAG: N-acetyltransferase [Rhodospirillaceae bacterium]|nr:N-acetyltransferase [Rhodospirillaceae bacterium]
MPDGSKTQVIKVLGAIDEINAADWNACAGNDDPFVSHAFLSAMEQSGSVGADAGWLPQHLVLEDENATPLAVVPLYLKNNSYGEYVFDWGWADAYHRAGGRYYPKLQAAVPFTPVTGRRLLVRQDLNPEKQRALQTTMIAGLVQLAQRLEVSSFHMTFASKAEWQLCGELGMLQRTDRQFHWLNDGFSSFDGFLAALSSRKRKMIRKERRAVDQHDVSIRSLSGSEIETRHWDAFYRFYRDTSDKKWGQAYLNRDFFSRLGETMANNVLLIMAEQDGQLVGGALNLIGGNTLYGRYWGCLENFKFLHFEVCYYRAIDFAIETGLKRVEAGAQGGHKLQRGYLPHPTYSAHWIADPGFRDAVARFLREETEAVHEEIDSLSDHSPFKRS